MVYFMEDRHVGAVTGWEQAYDAFIRIIELLSADKNEIQRLAGEMPIPIYSMPIHLSRSWQFWRRHETGRNVAAKP